MATYRYNVIVDLSVGTASGGAQAASSAFQNISTHAQATQKNVDIASKTLERYQTQIDRFNKSTVETNKLNRGIAAGQFAGVDTKTLDALKQKAGELDQLWLKNQRSVGLFGAAFKGAFIGALTGFAVRATLGNIINLGDAILQAGESSIVAAANFERTTNAMRVFTGSTSSAKMELAEIAKLAANTPGLRLEDAEAGATRLRALGFAASTTQDLIVGLAKQKLLSGADEQAMNRVIVNITQLSSGSSRVTQDIKEMVQSMPTLRNALIDTFGSIDKFKAKLALDPKGTFKEFAEGLKAAESAQGGLTDAFGKLEDAALKAGRGVGEGSLEPLTSGVLQLTDYITDNMNTWIQWGQTLGDVIGGVIFTFNTLTKDVESGPVESFLNRTAAFLGTGGVSEVLRSTANVGEQERKRIEALSAPFQDRFRRGDIRKDFTINFGSKGLFSTDAEREQAAKERDALRERQAQEEIARKRTIEQTKQGFEQINAIEKSRYETGQAMLDQYIRNTSEEEVAYIKNSAALKRRFTSSDIVRTREYYDSLIKLSAGNADEIFKLQTERDTKIFQLNEQLTQSQLQEARQLAEEEKKILDERRQNEVEFLNLRIDSYKAFQEREAGFIERDIDLYGRGFDRLEDLTRDTYAITADLTFQSFQKQLEDASLTAEQRVNIQSQMNIELYRLETENQQKIAAIQDRALQEQARRMRESFQSIQQLSQTFQGGLRSLLTTVQPNALFGTTTPGAGAQTSLHGLLGDKGGLFELDDINNVLAGTAKIYDFTATRLDKIHQNQQNNITREIELTEVLLEFERNRALTNERIQKAQFENQLSSLRNQVGQTTDPEQLKILNSRIEFANQQITLKEGIISNLEKDPKSNVTAETTRLTSQIRRLNLEQQVLGVEQDIEKNQLRQTQHIGTINELTKSIAAGQRDGLLFQLQELNLTTQRRDAVIDYRTQEVFLANENLVNLSRETELIRAVSEMRKEELDAVYQIDRAQLRINQQLVFSQKRSDAAVLDFLANQKGITEIISDTKINLLSAAYNGLDTVLGRVTKRFGAMGDVIKDLISSLLKLALNTIFQKFLVGGNGSSSGAGFNLGGLFGGGGGGGGLTVPGFAGGLFNIGGGGGPGLLGGGGGGLFGSSTAGGLVPPGFDPGVGGLLSPASGAAPPSLGGSALGGLLSLQGIGAAVATAGVSLGIQAIIASTQTHSPGVGFALGGVFGLVFGILNRNRRRKREEKLRNTAILNAFAAIDKLIADVNNDKIEGAQALEQADQIRSNYLTDMQQLKDKKTRQHALADVSRIDAKISELKTAVAAQTSRRDRLELMVPTFAAGGPAIGYQRGAGHGTSDNLLNFFPAAGVTGFTSPTEYVLDAETTRNIGTRDLDVMRATKGASYAQMRKQMVAPRMATGGSPIPNINFGGASSSTSSVNGGGPMTLELTVNVGLSEQDFVEVVAAAIRSNDGSTQQLTALVKTMDNNGISPFTRKIADQVQQLLR